MQEDESWRTGRTSMTDYNENGVEYSVHGQIGRFAIGGYMPDQALKEKIDLTAALIDDAKDEKAHDWIQSYLGIVHHLDALLLSVETIADQVSELQKSILAPVPNNKYPKLILKRADHKEKATEPPCLIGISSQRVEIECEIFLLRAVSLLERLTAHLEAMCGLGKVRSFFHLETALNNNPAADPRCPNLLTLLQEVKPTLNRTVLSDGKNTSLRNVIAHRASSPELMDKGFSINWVSKNCLLAFDAELDQFPLIGTIRTLARAIPYYVIETLRVLLIVESETSAVRKWADAKKRHQEGYEPTWKNPFIHYSSFIDSTDKGPLVSVVSWQPGGLRTHQRHLRPEVFDYAAKPKAIQARE